MNELGITLKLTPQEVQDMGERLKRERTVGSSFTLAELLGKHAEGRFVVFSTSTEYRQRDALFTLHVSKVEAAAEPAIVGKPAFDALNIDVRKAVAQVLSVMDRAQWNQQPVSPQTAERYNAWLAVRQLELMLKGAETPIDMILYCPNCGMQHIDAPERCPDEPGICECGKPHWDNRPHRSHECQGCKTTWRPADVATNGVAEIKTHGKKDTWPAPHNEEVRAMPAQRPHVLYTDADEDRPDVLCDRNGQVVLSMCRVCGQAEADLVRMPACPGPQVRRTK